MKLFLRSISVTDCTCHCLQSLLTLPQRWTSYCETCPSIKIPHQRVPNLQLEVSSLLRTESPFRARAWYKPVVPATRHTQTVPNRCFQVTNDSLHKFYSWPVCVIYREGWLFPPETNQYLDDLVHLPRHPYHGTVITFSRGTPVPGRKGLGSAMDCPVWSVLIILVVMIVLKGRYLILIDVLIQTITSMSQVFHRFCHQQRILKRGISCPRGTCPSPPSGGLRRCVWGHRWGAGKRLGNPQNGEYLAGF